MPELPEVETVRRGLAPVWEGRRFVSVVTRRPDLRQPFPERFAERLTGRTVTEVGRRAKYLLVRTDGPEVMIGHLGMSGRMVIGPLRNDPPGRHDHVEFVTDAAVSVTFTDPRRFGLLTLCEAGREDDHPLLAGLGPEPLGDGFTAAHLRAALDGRAAPIKAMLLDQKVVAGLGNIYVSESLYRAGGSLTAKEIARLVDAARAVLEEAIAAGGSSLKDHVQPSGELGYFQHRFAVYDREGEKCPDCDCDVTKTGGVRRIVQSNRSTFYCAKRQR